MTQNKSTITKITTAPVLPTVGELPVGQLFRYRDQVFIVSVAGKQYVSLRTGMIYDVLNLSLVVFPVPDGGKVLLEAGAWDISDND